MGTTHGLGWLPDVPKIEDYSPTHPEVAPLLQKTKAANVAAPTREAEKVGRAAGIPGRVDLRQWFSPIENQGSLGSCTANAAIALIEYFERRASGGHVDASRLFLYKVERNLLGWTGDTGAYLRTAMEALVLFGAPPEQYWPYDGSPAASNSKFDLEPSSFCYAFAANYQALKYFRLDSHGASPAQVLAKIKKSLAGGFPIMFGFPVYSEYDNPLPGALVAYPAAGSHYRGGHANVAAGYDDNKMINTDKGALLVRNSWGDGWGDGGYAWMSYRYVLEEAAYDWWTMISAKWVDTGQF